MKDKYEKSVTLRCITCGDTSFDSNHDNSWMKCNKCNREYHGGYDELVEHNKEEINEQLSKMKNEVNKDIKKELERILRNTFKMY